VSDRDIPLIMLPGRGIERRVTVENVRSIWALCRAFVMAIGSFAARVPGRSSLLGGLRQRRGVVRGNAVPGADRRRASRTPAPAPPTDWWADSLAAARCPSPTPICPARVVLAATRCVPRSSPWARIAIVRSRALAWTCPRVAPYCWSFAGRSGPDASTKRCSSCATGGTATAISHPHVYGSSRLRQLAPESIRPRPGRISYAAVRVRGADGSGPRRRGSRRLPLGAANDGGPSWRSSVCPRSSCRWRSRPANHQTFQRRGRSLPPVPRSSCPDAECDADRSRARGDAGGSPMPTCG